MSQDGFDLVTGAWTPQKNPVTAASLIADTRPLITRAVCVTLIDRQSLTLPFVRCLTSYPSLFS